MVELGHVAIVWQVCDRIYPWCHLRPCAHAVHLHRLSADCRSDVLGGDGPTVIGPGAVPGVSVFASCTVARRTGTTVWFGYNNPLAERRVALVESANAVYIKGYLGALNRGQVTQFQPGVVERAFAVTVPVGSTATWAVTPANILGVPDSSSSATSGPSTPACPSGVGVRSATPQIVGGLVPTISALPVNQLVSNGLLVRSSLKFSTNGVVSACSDGGVPLALKCCGATRFASWWSSFLRELPTNRSADKIVRSIRTLRTASRSSVRTRRLVGCRSAERQRVRFAQEQLAGTAQIAWATARRVIADVEARCQFPNGVVELTTVWVDLGRQRLHFHT